MLKSFDKKIKINSPPTQCETTWRGGEAMTTDGLGWVGLSWVFGGGPLVSYMIMLTAYHFDLKKKKKKVYVSYDIVNVVYIK